MTGITLRVSRDQRSEAKGISGVLVCLPSVPRCPLHGTAAGRALGGDEHLGALLPHVCPTLPGARQARAPASL